MFISKTDAAKFWTKVDKRGPRDCWLWTAGRVPYGYGSMYYGGSRNFGAHRFSWLLANPDSDIPKGHCICHTCDNPPCVNPAHLFLGSTRDNAIDGRSKGRGPGAHLKPASHHPEAMPRGERHWNSKYTPEQIAAVRTLFDSGMRQCDIMRAMNIPRRVVQRLVMYRGKHWAHIK
jgi:hypothetical protein